MCVCLSRNWLYRFDKGEEEKNRDENTYEYVDIHAVWQIELQRVSETKSNTAVCEFCVCAHVCNSSLKPGLLPGFKNAREVIYRFIN